MRTFKMKFDLTFSSEPSLSVFFAVEQVINNVKDTDKCTVTYI